MLNAWWNTTAVLLGLVLGVVTALAILVAFLLVVNRLVLALRYSRPAWWLRRHRPTRQAP